MTPHFGGHFSSVVMTIFSWKHCQRHYGLRRWLLPKSTIQKSCSLSLRLVQPLSHRSDCRRRNFWSNFSFCLVWQIASNTRQSTSNTCNNFDKSMYQLREGCPCTENCCSFGFCPNEGGKGRAQIFWHLFSRPSLIEIHSTNLRNLGQASTWFQQGHQFVSELVSDWHG